MKEDTRKNRRQGSRRRPFSGFLPRFAFLACLALVMVALGAALAPVRPQEPAEPPLSERARSAALAATLQLKDAGEQLARAASGSGPGTGQPALSPTVTLLTTQARALLAPHDVPRDGSATPSPADPATSPPAPPPASVAALAAGLADSGSQRLADAALADGGMARLLAAVGTAQLLEAASLAPDGAAPDSGAGTAPAGVAPAEATSGPAAAAQSSATCPAPDGTPSSPRPGQDRPAAPAAPPGNAQPGNAPAAEALAATIRAEAKTVYGYQVALPRLAGPAAQSGARQLAGHEAALSAAETLARQHCFPIPPREAGYTLEGAFLAAPAAGLAGLEAGTLAVYGDLVALSDGEVRRWAIAGLLEAGRRSLLWGAEPGPLPGLAADPEAFPPLPAASPQTGPARD